MALEEIKAEISLLLSRMENQPEDKHELYMQLRERLNEMRAYGMPPPDDLKQLLADLEAEFEAEKTGRKKK